MPKPAFEFRLASAGDEPELRRLLRENPMPGQVALTLQREPNFFLASTVEGDQHQTIVAREKSETRGLAGLASRSVRDAWLDGTKRRLGYISQLRLDRRCRGGLGILRRGFALMRELHEVDRETPYYVTTIFEDNKLARRVLEKDWAGKPTYRRRGVISTLALPLWRRRPAPCPAGVSVRRGSADDRDRIAGCLQRSYRAYQFAPYWSARNLADRELVRGLSPEDFWIATRVGRVVACLAVWRQQGFKQTVVHSYQGRRWHLRHLSNLAAPLARWPRLPNPGEGLPHAYVSHVAADDDEQEAVLTLLASAYNSVVDRGHAYVTLGLAEGHPLLPAVKEAFWHIEYRAVLYLVYWEDGARAAGELDGRLPHLEVAVL